MSFPGPQPVTQTEKDSSITIFSGLQLFWGCLTIGSDIYLTITDQKNLYIIGILTGSFFALSGLIGILSNFCQSRGCLIFVMIMSIISAILCWPLIVARGFVLIHHWTWQTRSTKEYLWQIIYSCQVLIALTQKGVSIATAISANRKNSSEDSAGQVYFVPNPQNNVPVWNP